MSKPAPQVFVDQKRRSRLSLRTDVVPGNFTSALRLAADIGAGGVQLDARNHFRPSELSDTAVRQLRKMLDDLNLRVTSLRFPTRGGYDQSDRLEARIDATKAAMRLARRLDCSIVINSLGSIPDPETQVDAYEQLTQVVDDLGRFGTHVGAFLAAETDGQSPAMLRDLLETSESGYVAVAINPGRLIINRHAVDEAVKLLGERTMTVAAVDGVIDLSAGRGLEVPLGQGIADFAELVGSLEHHQFAGDLVVGRPGTSIDEIYDAAEFLRNVLTG